MFWWDVCFWVWRMRETHIHTSPLWVSKLMCFETSEYWSLIGSIRNFETNFRNCISDPICDWSNEFISIWKSEMFRSYLWLVQRVHFDYQVLIIIYIKFWYSFALKELNVIELYNIQRTTTKSETLSQQPPKYLIGINVCADKFSRNFAQKPKMREN